MTAHEKSGVLTLELSDGVKLEMVKVEAGTLTISAAHREKQVCPHCGQPIKASTVNAANGKKQDNGKQHTATLTKAFYIGKTEVTQAQWKAVMGNNPSNFQSDVLPVEGVSWNDAMTFCEKLNAMGKAPKGWKFTLPTEAQWEYAARGGSKSNGHKYSGVKDKDVGKAAWYKA
ncbi:MAG: formylglycine-generating enzyme family protein, partial [Lentisphaeria bacterium]|nr:formylglycine-generating enzyme family protein [Lentisphaeria bacterium]